MEGINSMKDHLIFDVTSAATIADSDSVGAYIRSSDGTLIDHQTINASEWLQVASALFDSAGNGITSSGNALDVNIASSDIQIDVDLVHTEDSVRLGDGTNFLTSTTVGADIGLDVNLINASIVVTASDLDIRDLVYTSDSVTAYQGTDPWVIGDGGNSITVDASDLDIRDLTAASDSVAAYLSDGAGNAIGSTSNALDVYITNASLTVSDAALANTAFANAAKTVADSAVTVVTSPLSARKYLDIYNNGNLKIYLGDASVTTANGFPLSPGSYMEFRAGAAQALYMVSATAATQDVRTLEFS